MPKAKRSHRVSERPTGTVTFLFTDVEDSSKRWERDRAAMEKAVRLHDELMRQAIESNDGYVFKTVGDAFCAVFDRAEYAIVAAVEAQRALAAADFSAVHGVRVRMALHAGTADERGGDYFGSAVNRVARLLEIAQAGQVLVSGLTADLAREQLPEGVTLSDLGRHRLRDLSEAERVFQVVAGGLEPVFPAPPSLGSLPNNLPLQLTPLIGRTEERAEIRSLLLAHRLVTLTGAGGIGKTRLALQVGAEMLDAFGDGVWFIDLAPFADANLVPNAIAAALGLQESPSRPMLETLAIYLKNKAMLLILDNCEHVLAASANAVDTILRRCAEITVLATTLEALGIAGERLYRTPALEIPADSTRALSASEAMAYPAIALFVDRAQAANSQFVINDADAPIIADICRRLDGVALAIELAAAHIKIVSVKVLDEKLDERFRLLKRGNRTAPPRQQTLHALIDWSYDLLSEPERALFRRLAVFAGGFTLDLAVAVCNDVARAGLDALDLLPSLIEKSLVQPEITGENPRYRLLETTRLYAREKLVEHGEFGAASQAHACGLTALAERLAVDFGTMADSQWESLAEPELENWRAVLEWSLGSGHDVPLGQRLAATLRPLWASKAAVEGRRWIQMALEAVTSETPAAIVARLELADASIAMYLTLWKAMLAAAQRAIGLFERTDDTAGAAEARIVAGRALALLGDARQSEALLRPALEACEALERPRLTAMALESLAMARMTAGDIADSRPLYGKALSVFQAIGAEKAALNVAANLAGAEFRGGDAATALRLAQEMLVRDRALNNPRVAVVMCNIAAYHIVLGRWEEARNHAWEALDVACERHLEVQVVWALQHLAAVAALSSEGDVERAGDLRRRAARLLGFVEARLAALDTTRKFTEQQEYTAMLAALHEALTADELSGLMAQGASWSDETAIAEARGL
jgi:predicted ATPase/class 3 adenylate cyclase